MLRRRKGVAGVLKREALDPDVAETAFARRESLFARCNLDAMLCGIALGNADVQRGPGVLDPRATVRRAADFLHDRATASSGREPVARRRLVGRLRRALQRRARQLALLLDRLERF